MVIERTPPPGEGHGMQEVGKAHPMGETGKPFKALTDKKTLSPQEAAKVWKQILLKQLLMASLKEIKKESQKQKEISKGDV